MMAAGTSAAFSPSFLAYCVLRFLSGMAMTGIIITSLCLSEYPCGAPAAPLTAVRPRGGGALQLPCLGLRFPICDTG